MQIKPTANINLIYISKNKNIIIKLTIVTANKIIQFKLALSVKWN